MIATQMQQRRTILFCNNSGHVLGPEVGGVDSTYTKSPVSMYPLPLYLSLWLQLVLLLRCRCGYTCFPREGVGNTSRMYLFTLTSVGAALVSVFSRPLLRYCTNVSLTSYWGLKLSASMASRPPVAPLPTQTGLPHGDGPLTPSSDQV